MRNLPLWGIDAVKRKWVRKKIFDIAAIYGGKVRNSEPHQSTSGHGCGEKRVAVAGEVEVLQPESVHLLCSDSNMNRTTMGILAWGLRWSGGGSISIARSVR